MGVSEFDEFEHCGPLRPAILNGILVYLDSRSNLHTKSNEDSLTLMMTIIRCDVTEYSKTMRGERRGWICNKLGPEPSQKQVHIKTERKQ